MTCKKLYCILLSALLLLPLCGDTLTIEQTLQLQSLLMRYEQNETMLSDELKVLNQNLTELYKESDSLKKQTKELESLLTTSRLQAESLILGLEDMGESIEILETSLIATERKNRIYKYGIITAAAVAVVEAIIIVLK